ncbi:hypothetical protein M1N05_00600 [Dehalococcoidales bacterium]|nr:hypothetical protein [Dehalococcoidales bacterium]
MKIKTRKTGRIINRFRGVPAIIFGSVFAVGSVIGELFFGWVGVLVAPVLARVCVKLYYLYMKASTEIQYFEGPIGFKIPDENMISKAVGILNTEKVEPFYPNSGLRPLPKGRGYSPLDKFCSTA